MMLRWGGGALILVLVLAALFTMPLIDSPASVGGRHPETGLRVGDEARYRGEAGGGAGEVTFTILGIHSVVRADGTLGDAIAVRAQPGADTKRAIIDFVDAGTGRTVVRWTPCSVIKSGVCTTAGGLDWGARGLPTVFGGSLEWGTHGIPSDGVPEAADGCSVCLTPLRMLREADVDGATRVRLDVSYVRNLSAWDIPRGEYVVRGLHPFPVSARIGDKEYVLQELTRGSTPLSMPHPLPPLLPPAGAVPHQDGRAVEGRPAYGYPSWEEAYAAHPPPVDIIACGGRAARWFNGTLYLNDIQQQVRTNERYELRETCEMRDGSFVEYVYTRTAAYPDTPAHALPPEWTRTATTVEPHAARDCAKKSIPIWTLVESGLASPLWRGTLNGYAMYATRGCESHYLNVIGEPQPGEGQTFHKTAEHLAFEVGTGRLQTATLYWNHPFAATLPR